ncbi:hypothetical protein GCM10009733_007580 [Nonomuraea maheshkhaliensis]|uniref:Schlafen AlbA-2 domain-containing protein n=1 Tax=Nonomuraea maheshkhaliensis TaxID=419590 RepID=A0ABP4QNR4_9ACTN
MTVSSRAAVIEALASGRAEELLDTAENAWLDFKSSPYALKSDKAKFELCKDVAAFANAQGGLLVLGVKASKRSDKAMEVATDLHPFPQERADVDGYIDTLNDYLRPRVAINHRWYEDHSRSRGQDATSYYLVIEVEPVPESDRYVIVRRTLNDKGMFADGLAVPVRHGDRTVYLPSEDVYRLISEGLRSRYALSTVSAPPGQELQEAADQSIDSLQRLQDWDDEPVLMWQSIPPHTVQILPGLHSDNGVRGALRNQDVLRPVGFNFFDSTGRLRTHEGGVLIGQGRRAVWVRPDGVTTAAAIATPAMLCWAMEARGLPQRLNSLVLAEMTLEYFRLADEVVVPLISGTWRHRIVARRFAGEHPRVLGPGGSGESIFLSDGWPASMDTWDSTWPAVADPERDAYEALQRIYALFGIDAGTNPDVEGDRVPVHRFRNSS